MWKQSRTVRRVGLAVGVVATTFVVPGAQLAGAAPPPALFGPPTFFGTGSFAGDVVAGDFNGDGNADLAVPNGNDDTVSILLGNGAGGFTANPVVAVGNAPIAIDAGDLNLDGKLDLITVNALSSDASILLGNGLGGFTAAAPVSGPSRIFNVEIGDLNGDGKPDFVGPMDFIDQVGVFLGNGAGGFTASPSVAVGNAPQDVAIGDLNGDSKPDLVSANFGTDNVSILLGDGLGGFTANPAVAAGGAPTRVAIGDLNGDGKRDLVVADFYGGGVTILLGDGTGAFTQATGSPIATGTYGFGAAIGDLNADGLPDLVVTNAGSNNISILLGDGTGAFIASPGSPIAVGSQPSDGLIANLNGDARPDIAVPGNTSDNVAVLLGSTTPSLSIADNSIAEGNKKTTDLVFTISLSAPASGDVKVEVKAATDGISASNKSDYEKTSKTVKIKAGQTSATFKVKIKGDTKVEADETFKVTLSKPKNAIIGDGEAIGTILNDD